MAQKVDWITDFVQAISLAGIENKAVLLDFFNPG